VEIVVDAEAKNQAGRNINAKKSRRRQSLQQSWIQQGKSKPQNQAEGKGQEDGDAAEPGKRSLMDMPPFSWK